MNIVYGNILADRYYQQIAQKISSLKGRKPKLLVILVGEDSASKIYVAAKEKACHKAGLLAETKYLPAEISEEELMTIIQQANQEETIDGILLQLPLPKHLSSQKILSYIATEKDVDGLKDENVLKLINKDSSGLFPCTPLGVMALLEEMKAPLQGKRAVIIGRSRLVGLPLFHMLLAKDCTVTLCHSKSENIKEICQQADILISAVGKAKMITKDFVKQGAYVVDVGVSRVDGKIYGDVDFEEVKDIASAITPMPKGTGPMTIAMLVMNTYKAFQRRQHD